MMQHYYDNYIIPRGQCESDQEILNPNADPQYDKRKWIKCEYNERIKRIYEPPKQLPELITVLQKRFEDLDEFLQKYQRDINEHEENIMKYLSIAYVDSDGEENGIDENINLYNAYKYAEKRPSKKVLKMKIKVKEPKNEQNIQQSQVIHHSPNIASQNMNQEIGKKNFLEIQLNAEPIQGIQMLDTPHRLVEQLRDRPSVDVSSEEILNQMKIFEQYEQQKRQQELQAKQDEELARKLTMEERFKANNVKDEERKKLLQEQQQEKLRKIEELKRSQMSQSQLNNSIQRPINIFNKKLELKVYTKFQKIKKLRGNIGGQQVEPKFLKKVMKGVKNFFKGEQDIPENKQIMALVMNDKEQYKVGMPNSTVKFQWEVMNKSNMSWGKNVVMKNFCTDDANVKDINFPDECSLNENEMANIQLEIVLPPEIQGKEKIILQFMLRNSKKECFGESMIAIIDINAGLNLGNEIINDKELANQIIGQSIIVDQENIMKQASLLSDQGYGSFDRCSQILTACKGNVKEATTILSKLMIKENKE